jgi:hypothetical protein
LRLFAVSSGDEVVYHGFVLALLVLLLPIVPFGTPIGALGIFVLALPLVLVTTKDGTNCLLIGGIASDDVHQLIGGGGVLRPNSRTSSLQVVLERKVMVTSESVMLGSSVCCLEKCRI